MNKPTINFNHSKDLRKILVLTEKTFERLLNDLTLGIITPRKRMTYKYIFESYLYAVADLSLEVNNVREELETYYKKTYKTSPVLGNKLFYEDYFDLHKEYDKVKKEIWRGIFKVDGKKLVEPDILR